MSVPSYAFLSSHLCRTIIMYECTELRVDSVGGKSIGQVDR